MANLEVTRATASTTQAVLTEAFSVNVTVKNKTSKAISVAYLIFTIDGSTATATRSDFSIGASKTITVTATFDGSTHPSAWTTAMQSRRSAALYVAASDNGTTTSDAVAVESFDLLDAYYTPKIEKFIVERTADEANTVKATIKLSHADGLTTTQINRLSCSLSDYDGTEYRTLTLHRTVAELYTGVTDDTAIITDTFDTGKDHTLTLVFGDTAEVVQQIDTVEHAFANLHLSGASTGGVCFGGFCKSAENNPMFECYYPAYFYGGIEGIKSAQCGTTELIAVNKASYSDKTVTFSTPFTERPTVMLTLLTGSVAYAMGNFLPTLLSVTTTGFTMRLFNNTGANRSFYVEWLAYGQM